MISRPCLRSCRAAGRILTWQAEHEPPTARTTARPRFLSSRRWNSARSRGGISASSCWISSLALTSSSLIVRWSARQSLSFSSCCSVSAGRFFSRASRSARAVSISSSSSRNRSSVARIELLHAVDLVQGGRVLPAGLHVAKLGLVLLELLLQVGELERRRCRLSSSAWVSRALSPATASTLSRYSRSTSMSSAGPCRVSARGPARTGSGSAAGRAARGGRSSRHPEEDGRWPRRPEMEKGVPVVGHPCVAREF